MTKQAALEEILILAQKCRTAHSNPSKANQAIALIEQLAKEGLNE